MTNLALACTRRNAFKGTNIHSVDPRSLRRIALFHPRRNKWLDHFRLSQDGAIVGLSPVGRATVRLLQMNSPARNAARLILLDLGEWSP